MSDSTNGALRLEVDELSADLDERAAPMRGTDARPLLVTVRGATVPTRGEDPTETPHYDPRIAMSETDEAALYKAYGELAEKETLHGLTRAESTRMRYLSWQIDRLEMAELAPAFDRLTELANIQRTAATAIQDLTTAVKNIPRRR